jgi:hypothetical protein
MAQSLQLNIIPFSVSVQLFTLKVQHNRANDGPELVVSFDGTTKVLNKSIAEIHNFKTERDIPILHPRQTTGPRQGEPVVLVNETEYKN